MAQLWKTRVRRQVVSIDFDKKREKIWFFNFSSNKSYFFCLKLNSMWKMLSLEVLHVEIAQNYKIWKFCSFLAIFANFLCDFWKNFLNRGQMSLKLCQLLENIDFWAKIYSEAEIDGEGHPEPPLFLAGPLRYQSD